VLIKACSGPAVSLRPVRWQFPPDAGAWDDQWLIVSGTVDLGDRTWSFTDPCLLVGEARELAAWLREVATGQVEPDEIATDHDGEPSLSFMEPPLGFSVSARDGEEFVVRISFAAEAAPPWLHNDDPNSAQYPVELRLRSDQLLAAADTWVRELDALPTRSFTSTR
jgi:hypothetical protein